MKKLMNDPRKFVEDFLEGILAAYPDFYRANSEDRKAIVRRDAKDHVSVITGGGMGHLPLFLGYLGDGLCSGVAMGNVFSTPGCDSILWVTQQVPHDRGVLYIIGNYTGDIMNFQMAAALARKQGMDVRMVIVSDDVATAPRDEWKSRRCISGVALIYKIAGAAAASGLSLDEVERLARYANERLSSMGAAFTPCQLPDTQTPIFSIGENEMELGVGIHGEPGVRRTAMMSSREIARYFFSQIVPDLQLKSGDSVAVLVNGLGATPKEELFIFYRDFAMCANEYGLEVECRFVDQYATSLGMSGVSVSVLKLDERLAALLREPCYSPLVHF